MTTEQKIPPKTIPPRPVETSSVEWPDNQSRLNSLNKELDWEQNRRKEMNWWYANLIGNMRATDQKIALLRESIVEVEERIECGSLFG